MVGLTDLRYVFSKGCNLAMHLITTVICCEIALAAAMVRSYLGWFGVLP